MTAQRPTPRSDALDFDEVCRNEAPYLVRALRYFGVPERDVPDIAQEVLIVVHRKLPEFEQRSSVRTWLYRICQRAASDYRKKASVRHERVQSEFAEPAPSELGGVAQLEARSQLLHALDRLDGDKRDVFVLYEIEGLEMKRVAEVLECPLQTAYSRLHAARATLVEALRGDEPESPEHSEAGVSATSAKDERGVA
ncbi:MAG TPA: RNA polymerase sigma factor [Polyangiaceae bacterium]|jgi:RNA polymerase sigma-70 factor (ECF subfamily)|nr:RNA polymerase sigma factor [Polyangiaceae bacterium]